VSTKRARRLELAVLGVLADGQRWFVLDIAAALELGAWGAGRLYAPLRALEDAGRVTSGWSDAQDALESHRRWYALPLAVVP